MATIKDVARLAGVSVATVSRVINSDDVVTRETKQRVEAAVKSLNYSPNLLGRNLRRLETKKIVVILNTISNQFYSRVVKGIEERAREEGYTVMVCMTHGDKNLESDYLKLLRFKLVDGAVFLTSEEKGELLGELLKGIPVVQACEPKSDFNTPSVSIDNERAAFEAVEYLIKMGHKKIACLGSFGSYPSVKQREDGYKRAMSEHQLLADDSLLINEGFSFNAGIRAANRLLALKELPTAAFCLSDSCAAGVIKTLAEKGIKTPDDISVMGFDDTQLSGIYIPSITTTRQPQYELGFTAMELLLSIIKHTSSEQKNIILPHEIIKRQSVASIGQV